MEKDKEYKVLIPDEHYQLLKFTTDELPGTAVVNSALADFESKEVFPWHCSVLLHCEDLIENGMPSNEEVNILNEFGDFLDDKIKGENKLKPNGLFLARITWNKTRELVWRIYDPELTNDFLSDIIENKSQAREFEYRIDHDEEWKMTEWHLKKRE